MTLCTCKFSREKPCPHCKQLRRPEDSAVPLHSDMHAKLMAWLEDEMRYQMERKTMREIADKAQEIFYAVPLHLQVRRLTPAEMARLDNKPVIEHRPSLTEFNAEQINRAAKLLAENNAPGWPEEIDELTMHKILFQAARESTSVDGMMKKVVERLKEFKNGVKIT